MRPRARARVQELPLGSALRSASVDPTSDSGARRRLRFGVAAHSAPGAAAWRDLARKVEDLGFATLLLPDHANPQLAPIAGLTAAAGATTTLRVGTQVLCNDLRNPVVTAKEMATLDLLSDGRADWGMGAGWLTSDYDATGIPFDPPGTRVGRLIEAVHLIRALFSGEPVDHDGAHYRVHGIAGSPAPVQRPHPPLLVGGSHERLLRFAGAEADIVSISPSWSSRQFGPYPASIGVEESMDRQVGWVRSAADGAGGRFERVELSLTVMPVAVTEGGAEGRAAAAERIAPNVGLTPEQVLVSPHVLVGGIDQICDTVLARRDRWGLSNWVVPIGALDAFAPVVARLAGS